MGASGTNLSVLCLPRLAITSALHGRAAPVPLAAFLTFQTRRTTDLSCRGISPLLLAQPSSLMAPAAPPALAPGAEFLRRRLARAEAIPPAERPPEVAAYVAAAALQRDACRLLADG